MSTRYRSVTVAMDGHGKPEHLLRKPNIFARRLQTPCGAAPWTDGLGKPRKAVRNAYTVELSCLDCWEFLYELVGEWVDEEDSRLYD